MLKDFDIAFTNKVKAWYSNTIYANTAIVYNVAYNLVEDDITKNALRFPLISIYRPSGFEPSDIQNFAARKRGVEYYYDDDTHTRVAARFITVNLVYQLDIYTKTPETLDDITENIMQAFNFDQTLEVTQIDIKNSLEYTESYDITYISGPVEQSEFQNDDRIYHYSIAYEIKNARLLNFRVSEIVTSTEVDIDVEGGSFYVDDAIEGFDGGEFEEE
jgi:hypothetical protein